jgi:Flp pilus assembly protein TadB
MVGMMQMTGTAASLTALCQLPEATQIKQLENDGERERLRFDLEAKRLEAMRSDREARREDDRKRFETQTKTEQRTESMHYAYVVGVTVLLALLVGGLCWVKKYELAITVVSAGIAFGAGWVGGRTSGYSKARKDVERESRLRDDDDD